MSDKQKSPEMKGKRNFLSPSIQDVGFFSKQKFAFGIYSDEN